jgi:hypothetical protein
MAVVLDWTIQTNPSFPHLFSFGFVSMDDGSQRMYYVGQCGKETAIGVAKLEPNSKVWVREQSSIVFAES